jgi:hypothetical protein
MAQQTAVDWVIEKFNSYDISTGKAGFRRLLNEAKEMEKQQIESAWKKGDGEHDKVADELSKKYYTETYGK